MVGTSRSPSVAGRRGVFPAFSIPQSRGDGSSSSRPPCSCGWPRGRGWTRSTAELRSAEGRLARHGVDGGDVERRRAAHGGDAGAPDIGSVGRAELLDRGAEAGAHDHVPPLVRSPELLCRLDELGLRALDAARGVEVEQLLDADEVVPRVEAADQVGPYRLDGGPE